MKIPSLPISACFGLAAAALALSPASLMAKEADGSWIEAGPAYAWMETPTTDRELAGLHAGAQTNLASLAMLELSTRAGYTYLESVQGGSLYRHDGSVDLLLSGSLLGMLTPYAGGGIGAIKSNELSHSGTDDLQVGARVEAGLGISILPALFEITPAVRYFHSDKMETATYSLDGQVHLSVIGLGVRAEYEENLIREGSLTTVMAYATLRF